jgi:serine phosphatase RsbU (regulator of sigma subunit)
MLAGALYQDERITLNGEETLIAYSDGLIEAMGPEGEEFGESRVLSRYSRFDRKVTERGPSAYPGRSRKIR